MLVFISKANQKQAIFLFLIRKALKYIIVLLFYNILNNQYYLSD